MLKMTTVEARENFSEVINQAAYGNEYVVLTRRGKPLVAVISLKELRRLENGEKQEDSDTK
jgi:prevent-host-death family protein